MKRYRIYTEDRNSYLVTEAITRHGFYSATIYLASGLWKGETGASIVIEILEDRDKEQSIRALASDIKHFNKQEVVLITEEDIKADIILE